MTVDQVIADIQHHWAWVVAPRADRTLDDTHWDRLLAAAFPGHAIWNLGDGFNYSKCYTYIILVEEGRLSYEEWWDQEKRLIQRLGGQEHLLLLKLSVVAPYFLVEVLQRSLSEDGHIREREIYPPTSQQRDLVHRAEQFAERHGFTLLPRAYLRQLVPHAELERV